MNYYIIPKNYFHIQLKIELTSEAIKPYISYSLLFYMNDISNQLSKLKKKEDKMTSDKITLDDINKLVNPFEFIHSNVPGSKISVSKVKAESSIFFELMELFQIFNITDLLSLKNKINVAHLTHNYKSTNYLLNMIREENEDHIISKDFHYKTLYELFIKYEYKHKLDLIICEFRPDEYTDTKMYINNMILVLLIIIKYQTFQGTCIIKIDNIFYKPIIDVIYLLSGMYEKIILIKPTISNITKSERYLICKGFNDSFKVQNNLLFNINETLIYMLNNDELMKNTFINSIIDNEVPYYLLNKLEESNLVICQQQLEAYDQIMSIFKNKNREERIENLKRVHIQKCVQWCEKNQLPHNKFIDKVNMFLSSKKKIDEITEPVGLSGTG